MYLFFDTETTGLPRNWNAPPWDFAKWPRLVQLAWLQCDGSQQRTVPRSLLIKPEGFRIPWSASAVHGITHQRALAEGVRLKEALAQFSEAVSQSRLLVAHNITFDVNVVQAEFLRESVPNRLASVPKLCTMRASVDFCKLPGRTRCRWPTLSELYRKLFAEELDGAHDASVDVQACAKCFFELVKRGVIPDGPGPESD